MNGKIFNQLYGNMIFYKLTNESENHNGFKFKTGLNIDITNKGIFFTDIEHMYMWLDYGCKDMIYMRSIIIPNDATVTILKNKYKTNKIILSNRRKINNDKYLEKYIQSCFVNDSKCGYEKKFLNKLNLK